VEGEEQQLDESVLLAIVWVRVWCFPYGMRFELYGWTLARSCRNLTKARALHLRDLSTTLQRALKDSASAPSFGR